MPIYEYRCTNAHTFEVMQSMTDDPVATCETCNAPVQRVLHSPAVHFKGSGFYTTDYARKGAKAASSDGGEKPAESKSESKSEKSSEKATAAGSESASKGSSSS